MYNLIGCSDNYLKTSGALYPFSIDERRSSIKEYQSFKSKSRLIDKTNTDGIINLKITVSLRYLTLLSMGYFRPV